ncbi:Beta-1,3-galactosyltransferase 5 [Bulinus truncatus]|nr:Beta-1,3-galactosyltransferase 5 [Bulinus truncatus]
MVEQITRFECLGANDFINITRLRNKALFEIIEEDDLPSSNWSYYKENITSVNYLNYSFLITGEDICITEPAFLLIIIPSTINQTDHRDLIRKTWLRAAETNAWPRREIRDKIKHIFLFGSSAKSRTKDLEKLTIESFINRDIVMADFEDTYRNLTTKMLVGLKWTLKYCSHVQYVIKVDMDTVINVPLMLNLLHHIEENITSKTFLLGRQHGSKKPLVERSKKRWKVSQSEFPLVYYPRYLYGHTYVLSIASLEILLSASHNKPLIAPEDAFITGILPKLTGILRLNSPSFALCCRIILDCEVVWNEKVAITDAKTKEVSEKLWINIVKNTCNKNVSIRIKDYIMQ